MSTTLPANQMPLNHSAQLPGHVMTNPSPIKAARSGPMADRIFGWLAKGAALFTLGILIAILISLIISAWPAIDKYGLGFLTSSTWDPVAEDFGALVMIYGTLMTSFIALLIAVPVSFGIALFLTELSPAWLKRPLGTAIELLAAIPLFMACGVFWYLVRCWPNMFSSPCRRFFPRPLILGLCSRVPRWGLVFCPLALSWPS
jgi:phosphate transport system permease protein